LKVSARVLIDYLGYVKHSEGLQRNIIQVPVYRNRRGRRIYPQSPQVPYTDDSQPPPHGYGYVQTVSSAATYLTALSKEEQEENKSRMLEERQHELVFMSPMVRGFALKNKKWRKSSPLLKRVQIRLLKDSS